MNCSTVQEGSLFRGTYDFESPEFDWGDDYERPNIPPQDMIVYEMGVRSFTADASSGLPEGRLGTFLGLKEKVQIFLQETVSFFTCYDAVCLVLLLCRLSILW